MPKVHELMTRKPHVLTPNQQVYHAFAMMELRHLRHIPIVDDDGDLVGIISDRDLKKHMTACFRPEEGGLASSVMHQTLEQLMTCDPSTALPDDELKGVVRRMLDQKISAMIVLEEGSKAPVGILTDTDVLSFLYSLL